MYERLVEVAMFSRGAVSYEELKRMPLSELFLVMDQVIKTSNKMLDF